MIGYLDTSALVKLYIEERGTAEVRKLVERVEIVSTSRVAYPEARAGIARKLRHGELTHTERHRLVNDLDRDWPRYVVVELTESVTDLAAALVDRHPLRGFDAVHLASALVLQRRSRSDVAFSCFDDRLNAAAASEGLANGS